MKETTRERQASEPLLYSLEEVSSQLGGLGRTMIFKLIKEGRLRVTRIGRRTFVSRKELYDFVNSTESGGDPWIAPHGK